MNVTMYDTAGNVDKSIYFNAKVYLNRFSQQYHFSAICDGGVPHGCLGPQDTDPPYTLARAYDPKSKPPPQLTCENVPVPGDTWYSHFMSWPTFTAFVAPYDQIPANKSSVWLDTFSHLCHFDEW